MRCSRFFNLLMAVLCFLFAQGCGPFSGKGSGELATEMPPLPKATSVGEPSGANLDTNLNILVNGEQILQYRYKLGAADTTDCSDLAGYSAVIPVTTP